MPDPAPLRDRAMGALLGLAIGDALGMPTQTLAADAIARLYGRISGFEAPCEGHPVSRGLPAGAVTDDTEQALLLARRLLRDRPFDARGWAADLLAWEAEVRRRGLRDLLGPSTRRAVAALLDGADPAAAGAGGDTNGAAMRVAPVGIAVPHLPPARLLARVAESARVTHGAPAAIAAAAAVAAAVSAGVAGEGQAAAEAAAIRTADLADPPLAARIRAALAAAPGGPGAVAAATGTGVLAAESVPCAFGLVRAAGGDAWTACLMAANLGGDTDTIGAMAGAMAGAVSGAAALPADAVAEVVAVNGLDLAPLADALLALRAAEAAETAEAPA